MRDSPGDASDSQGADGDSTDGVKATWESAEALTIVDVDVAREQCRTLETGFTCPSPRGEEPAQYTITAVYRGQNETVLAASFAEWLDSLADRGEEMTGEAIASAVYSVFRREFGRGNAEVVVYQRTEGVTHTVEMGSC